MFEIGEKVVHRDYGLCMIKDISERSFTDGKLRKYYKLKPIPDDGYDTNIFVSVDNTEKLRSPMTPDQILGMIDSMPMTDPLEIAACGNRALDMENIRITYSSLMNSGDPKKWVVLLRTIHRKSENLASHKKRLPEFEIHARENTERLLYGEIAGVMDIPVSAVEDFVSRRIESAAARQ